MNEGGLHLIYVISSTHGSETLDYGGMTLDAWEICEAAKGTDARKIILLQLNCERGVDAQGILLNSVGSSRGDGGRKKLLLPFSTDMLLGYLPKLVGQRLTVVDFLCEELQRSRDLDELLVSVIHRMQESMGNRLPMYSSTMRARIPLRPQVAAGVQQGRAFTVTGGKVIAYMVEEFKEFRKAFSLREEDLEDFNSQKNADNICSAFKNFGFKVECRNGEINTNEILDRVSKFSVNEEEVPEMLVIIVSSHGDEDGTILASDYYFNVRGVLSKLWDLKSIPKLLIIDACRGNGTDREPGNPGWRSSIGPGKGKDFHLPLNTLLVMSSSQGNRSYCHYERGDNLIGCLSNSMNSMDRNGKLDLFSVLHDAMEEVAGMDIHTSPFLSFEAIAKQQVTFASTLTRPLHLKVTNTGQKTTR